MPESVSILALWIPESNYTDCLTGKAFANLKSLTAPDLMGKNPMSDQKSICCF